MHAVLQRLRTRRRTHLVFGYFPTGDNLRAANWVERLSERPDPGLGLRSHAAVEWADKNEMGFDTSTGERVQAFSTSSVRVTVALTGLAVAVIYVVADRLIEDVLAIEAWWGQVIEVLVMALVTGTVLWFGVLRPLHGQVQREAERAEAEREALLSASSLQRFEGRLHRGLEMASNEQMVYETLRKAADQTLGDGSLELLLADSREAHLEQVLATSDTAGSHCPVELPQDCPAVRHSQTLVFSSSEELDSCPQLHGRLIGPCSATCVPLSVGGRSIGVLHSVDNHLAPPTGDTLHKLEAIALQAGSRIGMLRVMASTTLQAATDPLTGLLNRRSFEDQVHQLIGRHQPFTLAMGDLDHFKAVNDTHGHEFGDRALRLFARTMKTSLRVEDLTSRYGGEEFVIAFPNCSVEQATDGLERVRAALLAAVDGGTVPAFTVSFGVAHSDDGSTLAEICRLADGALFRAKQEGRDRIVVHNSDNQSSVA